MNKFVQTRRQRKELELCLASIRQYQIPILVTAIESALTIPYRDDRDIFNQIEKRRHQLLARTDGIENIDFGAGFPDREYTKEQQRAGVRSRREIREITVVSSSDNHWGRVLYYLVRQKRPAKVLELGTCVGVSGAYIAWALSRNGIGHLWTLEGSPAIADLAQDTFRTLRLGSIVTVSIGAFNDSLEGALMNGPFDFVFIDGHHDGDATVSYFNQIKPHLSDLAIVLFDDIEWSLGMKAAWERIKRDRSLISHCHIKLGRHCEGFGIVAH